MKIKVEDRIKEYDLYLQGHLESVKKDLEVERRGLCMYTSYFARLNKLPSGIVPVSICVKPPKFYNGLEYKKLAPGYKLLMDYKRDSDVGLYSERFKETILASLDPDEVANDLLMLVGHFKDTHYKPKPCLVCFEKPSDFCHRQIVAEWLTENGYPCSEYTF